ncbi:hypothetical protein Thiowin_03280 [Thiorhodovibrio winogradskyi]|uniref:DUF2934 domain-containing protein n=1 Tax=Thiorhodovibrio winogradskyi TaxID=77007 RepID=A0ABZ0SDU1_9GAMM|nr:DUF2934 domain-containing protein [Thiorhodovibrio winogradskyi]
MAFSSFSINPDAPRERRRHSGERRNQDQGPLKQTVSLAEKASMRFAGAKEQPVDSTSLSHVYQAAVAKAAYFKAEARGFAPGFEHQDWVQAEQETQLAME